MIEVRGLSNHSCLYRNTSGFSPSVNKNKQTDLSSSCLGTPRKRALRSKWSKSTLKIKSAEKIKQSKRLARNQTIKIPQIPLSHPTGLQNQNNQNPGEIPGNGKTLSRLEMRPCASVAVVDRMNYSRCSLQEGVFSHPCSTHVSNTFQR